MIYHGYQFANPLIDKEDWVEVMGWLSGSIQKGKNGGEILKIDYSWPITHGDAISVSIDDYGNVLTSILGELEEKFNNKQSILGWYHTHPGYGLFMSQVDFNTQKSYQKLFDKAIAIVLDQTLISSVHYGIEIFRLKPDLLTFEKIPFTLANSFDVRLLIKILQNFQKGIQRGKLLKEYDS
jgi:proteasome lid subunit RPN8/RPN11